MKRTPSGSQIVKEYINGCRYKDTFKSFEEAQKVIPSLEMKFEKQFSAYFCNSCRNYHLTSKRFKGY